MQWKNTLPDVLYDRRPPGRYARHFGEHVARIAALLACATLWVAYRGFMKPVTVWERSRHRGRSEWQHNHVQDGHVPENQLRPIACTPEQEKGWSNDVWRKRLTFQDGQKILPSKRRPRSHV